MSAIRLFDESQFVPTKFATAKDKALFANHFLRFIEGGYSKALFTKAFYTRLSNTFGHIAHYNLEGFYENFFTSEEDKLAFLEQTLKYPCYGDPTYTFSDAEQAIQEELRRRQFYEKQGIAVALAARQAELATLSRLKQKYEPPEPEAETETSRVSAPPMKAEQQHLF